MLEKVTPCRLNAGDHSLVYLFHRRGHPSHKSEKPHSPGVLDLPQQRIGIYKRTATFSEPVYQPGSVLLPTAVQPAIIIITIITIVIIPTQRPKEPKKAWITSL